MLFRVCLEIIDFHDDDTNVLVIAVGFYFSDMPVSREEEEEMLWIAIVEAGAGSVVGR